MPIKYLMSWEGSPHFRWVKMFQGKRYRVSCDQLNCPRTKEGSWEGANRWWQEMLRSFELDRVAQFTPEQLGQWQDVNRKIAWAAVNDPKMVARLQHTKHQIEQQPPEEYEEVIDPDEQAAIAQNLETMALLTGATPDLEGLDAPTVSGIVGTGKLWEERLATFAVVQKNQSIGYQLERFLEMVKTKQEPMTHRELAGYLNSTLTGDFWVAETPVSSINRDTVTKHFFWLESKQHKPKTHNKYLGFFRRFVNWLSENELLEHIPRNLKSADHKKTPDEHIITSFTNVKAVVVSLPKSKQLWALLGLNCGFTNVDLGSVTWEHIDPTNWRLTFKRRKTKKIKNVPTVTYQLWPVTIQALERLPHRAGLLFKSRDGVPLYTTRYEDGKPKKSDMFSKYWQKISPKSPIPLKNFRHIGATAFKADESYRKYVDVFLGHSAVTLSDKVYAKEEYWEPFWRALDFTRQHLGF